MFTFSRLGSYGRFGNQLFQIAATIGMATKHRVDYIFPRWAFSDLFNVPIPQTDRLTRPDFVFIQNCYHYVDSSFEFADPCLVDLRGSFQSEKFFLHCTETVRSYFEPSLPIASALHAGYDHILRNSSTCIMIVRRGDYVSHSDQHPPQTAAFYSAAMDAFDRDTTFFVTSDDVAWCYDNVRRPNVIILPQESWAHNFFLGTLCQHAIVSNSTFGWWFAYLGKNPTKRVIAARRWLGPAKVGYDTKDLLPPGWITM